MAELPLHQASSVTDCFDVPGAISEERQRTLIDEIAGTLNNKSKKLRIMHLNTQSMTSTFKECLLTIRTYLLDIITLRETWLKNH